MRRSAAGWTVGLALAMAAHTGGAGHALAQNQLTTGAIAKASEVKPVAGTTVVAAVGDSLADGMWLGLYRLLQKDKRVVVHRGAKHSLGFTGHDLTDLIDKAVAAGPVHAFVMMIGANDRRSFFVDGKPKALLGTSGWADLYRGRVERFMDHAGKRDVPLIWVLLPVMRSEEATRDARLVNDIVALAAKDRPHVMLVDTISLTADENGNYQSHFKDLSGQKRQMRASDGLHFEQAGYELISDTILKRLREASPEFKALVEH